MSTETVKPMFNDRTYNILKYIAQIGLPALGVFYAAFAQLWELPKTEEVVGTIVASDLLLGALLRVSSSRYDASEAKYDGVMVVGEDKNSLVLNDDVETLEGKKDLTFKVEMLPGNDVDPEGGLP